MAKARFFDWRTTPFILYSAGMTVHEIIAAIIPYTGHFPEAAVQAAVAQREEVTPYLLRALEEVAETPENFASSGTGCIYSPVICWRNSGTNALMGP